MDQNEIELIKNAHRKIKSLSEDIYHSQHQKNEIELALYLFKNGDEMEKQHAKNTLNMNGVYL